MAQGVSIQHGYKARPTREDVAFNDQLIAWRTAWSHPGCDGWTMDMTMNYRKEFPLLERPFLSEDSYRAFIHIVRLKTGMFDGWNLIATASDAPPDHRQSKRLMVKFAETVCDMVVECFELLRGEASIFIGPSSDAIGDKTVRDYCWKHFPKRIGKWATCMHRGPDTFGSEPVLILHTYDYERGKTKPKHRESKREWNGSLWHNAKVRIGDLRRANT